MPETNWETLLRKDICHIIQCLTNVSVFFIVLPASAKGERVFHQMFLLNLVGNIFGFQEANFVSAIKPMFPDVGEREKFEQTLKITNVSYVWPRL